MVDTQSRSHPAIVTRSLNRSRWVAWLRRIGQWGLIVVTVLTAIGMGYQFVSERRDQDAFAAPGTLVDVGGYRLHLHRMGANQSGPTVLLDSAWGSSASQWGWIQPAIARFAPVVAFDRPGQGYSEAPPTPREAQQYASDLHTALQQLGITGPYVLVGHSMGALTSRAFAKQYPHDIAGMVLVDPRDLEIAPFMAAIYPDQPPVSADPTMVERVLPPLAARLGIMRLVDMLGEYVDQLPPDSASAARATLASTHHYDGMIPDALLGERAARFLAGDEALTTTPVIVLSASEADPAFPDDTRTRFNALHAQLALSLSQRGEHREITGANHYTIVTHERYAEQVTAVVRDMIKAMQ